MSDYTCFTCKVAFCDHKWQKSHYKSDWHHYNLKRKIVGLESIPLEAYEKLKQDQASQTQKKDDARDNYCKVCRKSFFDKKSLIQHNQSKKHKESESKYILKNRTVSEYQIPKPIMKELQVEEVGYQDDEDDDDNWETIDEDEDEDKDIPILSINQCLFCSKDSKNLNENLKHMSVAHSFFIPDIDYLVDIEGFLKHLSEKLCIDHICLWCSYKGKVFPSLESVQKHMYSKGHSKIAFETADVINEYSQFYDYSKSYPEEGNPEDEVNPIELDGENWEIVLPSGAHIGNRSLLRYYKQHLKPVKNIPQVVHKKNEIDKVINNYKELGYTGLTGEAAVQRAKDIEYFQKLMAKQVLRVGCSNNKTKQMYFRNQLGR